MDRSGNARGGRQETQRQTRRRSRRSRWSWWSWGRSIQKAQGVGLNDLYKLLRFFPCANNYSSINKFFFWHQYGLRQLFHMAAIAGVTETRGDRDASAVCGGWQRSGSQFSYTIAEDMSLPTNAGSLSDAGATACPGQKEQHGMLQKYEQQQRQQLRNEILTDASRLFLRPRDSATECLVCATNLASSPTAMTCRFIHLRHDYIHSHLHCR